MRKLILVTIGLLIACSEQAPEKKAQPSDDNCVGYIIKPDGRKECMERGSVK